MVDFKRKETKLLCVQIHCGKQELRLTCVVSCVKVRHRETTVGETKSKC